MTAADADPWYVEAFRAGYLDLYAHRSAEAAREEASGLVERGLSGRTLDLGCGQGRHALALAALGVSVVGLDRSAELLARSGELAGGSALGGRLARGDFRALPFAARSFDSVVMLFSSFGYFEDAENARVLDEVARVLAPGGILVLDLMNPERIRSGLVPESRTERDGLVLLERRRLERFGRRVVKDVRVCDAHGAERSWREDVRMYGFEELKVLLAVRGLVPERVEGDLDGRPFGPRAPRQIVWARRGAGP